jgi:PAS domain-containing protein
VPSSKAPQNGRAFYTLDRDLRIISASENTLALWGKTRAEVDGKYLLELFPFAEGGDAHEGLLEALRTFRPVRLKTESVYFGGVIGVEIYPIGNTLQVSFGPGVT